MLLMAIIHGLLGAICGLRFKVLIIIPLIAVVCAEIAFLHLNNTWWSAFCGAIALIVSLEIGYFVGGVLRQVYRSSGDRRASTSKIILMSRESDQLSV